MKKQSSCCGFFRRIFCKTKPDDSIDAKTSEKQDKFSRDKTEITISKKTISTEPKSKTIETSRSKSKENNKSGMDSDANSIFYDKNSALVDSVDKKKAIDNLEVAFNILNLSEDYQSDSSFNKSHKDQFTKVIKGINFKEILENEESIVLSERSNN